MNSLIQGNPLPLIIGVIGILLLLFVVLVFINFFGLWIQAKAASAPVSIVNLIMMRFRKVNPSIIVNSKITAAKAGLIYSTDELEAHFLAGGDIINVVLALVAAEKAGITLPFNRACAIDLATKDTGKTVLEAVRTSINPKVIDCPNPSGGITKITAVAKDGIGVNVRARVTVRTNLDRFVGGATEETIIARVGEGIVTSVGSAASYKSVLENPDSISSLVLEKGVDAATAFEILSIDIADVDIADNVGARLQTEQAEADKQVAQAKAEMRRAAAVATEQEMSARTQEMRAKLVEAEATVPLAIAEAFRNGNLGVMDYAKYQNVVADTKMRDSIGEEDSESH
ncbi:MAG: flotillin-like protein FloA [Akkermansiaceae bacterium]